MMVVSVIGMSWPGAVLTCLIALSLYYGGCQAAVGESCPVGNECTAPGEICSNGTCVCDTTTHFTNGTVCETKVGPGLSCAGLPPDACSTNSVCSNDICTCIAGFYDSDGGGSTGTCVPKIAAGLNCPVSPVDACFPNSVCSNNICTCNSGFYDSDGSGSTGTCVPKVGPGLTCAGLPPDACSTNSVCSNNLCTCNSGFYDSDGSGSTGTCVQKIAAGVNCVGLPVDACTPNSLCTNTICTCNSGFYDNDGGGSAGTCEPQIALSGTCNNSLGVTQCLTSGAVCATDNRCRCASGTFDDNGFGTADGVCRDMSLLLVTAVQASNLGINSVTISWTAPATYSSQVTRYEVTWTSTTQSGGSQSAGIATSLTVSGLGSNTQYSFTVQTVESGSQTSEQKVSSSALPITTQSQLGETCGTCGDSNAMCSTTCICNTGYYDNNGDTLGGTCVSTIALSGSCNSGLVGVPQCSDANAECTINAGGDVCRCMTGYFDSNGFSTTGGTCTAMSTLKVTGVSVTTPGTDTAIVTWTQPTDTSQVNNYQVIWNPAKDDGSSSYNAGTASTATISGFTSGSIYTFNVKSVESGSRTTAQEVESNSPYTASMKAALSVACGTGSPEVVCEDTTTASCTLNICRCNVGYFDSNGFGTSVATSGGVCTAMSNLKVTSVTSSLIAATSVTISWTPPTDSSQISGYVVVATISNSGSVEGTYFAANTATSTAITGLTSGTEYVFTVKSQETGSRSTTQEIESDVSVSVTTKVELTETCGGVIVCDDAMAECIAGNSGGTVCRCRSGYYDSNGYSTAGGVCTSINGLVVTSFMVGVEGTSTVTLEWSAPSPGSDQVNRYEVHWTPTLANGTTNYNAGKTTSVKLTGFVSGQTYSFYVKSIELGSRATEQEVQTSAKDIIINAGLGVVCTGGIQCADSNAECIQNNDGTDNVCRCKSTYFDSNSYSTSGGMCVTMSTLAVTGLTLAKEGTNTVNISWTPPSEYRNQVNRYEVHWTPSTTINGNTFYNAQLNTAVQLVGFVPGQAYTFSVRSVESGSRSQEQNYDTTASPITMNADLGSACNGGSIQCSDPNAFCTQTDDGHTSVCRCKSTHVDSNGINLLGGFCVAETTTPTLPPTAISTTTSTLGTPTVVTTSKPCPTTSSTPVTRPWRQLYDTCGDQGQDARCLPPNSACIPDKNGVWKCSCIPGFIETGVNCTKLPGGIFSTEEQFTTVPANAAVGHKVVTIEFSQILKICSTKPEVTLFGDHEQFEADVHSCQNVTIRTKSSFPLESSVKRLMVKAKFESGANVIMDAILVTVTIQSSVDSIVVVLPDMTFSNHFVTSVAPGGSLSLTNSDFMRITSTGDVYTKQELNVVDINSEDDEAAAILTTTIQRIVDSSTSLTSLSTVVLRTNIKRRISEDTDNGFIVTSFRQLLQSSLNVSVTSATNNNIFVFDGTVLKIQNAGELDYEDGQRNFVFTISVQITSNIRVTTVPIAIEVEVLPANDNVPEFVTNTGLVTNEYSFTLFPTPISSVVCGAVRARDADVGSQLFYSIDSQSDMVTYFTVGQSDGIVTTLVRTDNIPFRNNTGVSDDQYVTFPVQVRDETNLHTDSATVTVFLKKTPERNLGLNFTANVFENVSIATLVRSVSQSGYINYEFASLTRSADFSISPDTGRVLVSRTLDRETQDTYRFSVTAIEQASQSCALVVLGDLFITILDANDNPPVFDRTGYNGNVMENQPVNSKVQLDFPITATDADLGSFNFLITQGNSYFTISQSGEISTRQRLDRETTNVYDVIVIADDGKNSNQVVVKVTIDDENDNPPVFTTGSYSASIFENALPTVMTTVTAFDGDVGPNADLSYLLDGGGDSFDIGYKTGEISTTVPLDREFQASYRLTVTAIDGGAQPQSSEATVIIDIINVNDNDPEFVDDPLVLFVDEEVQCLSHVIGVLTATDRDGDSLYYNTSDARFTVVWNTGQIYCRERLDYEDQPQLELTVTVAEQLQNPRETSGTVIINLRDINDNSPVITHPNSASLQQNDFIVSRPIMVVDVEDKDSGNNGEVTFSLTGTNLASIDDNGIISTVAGVSPSADTYYATVIVSDRGIPSRTVTSTVAIQVTDTAEVNLKFTEQHHKFTVSEEQGPDTLVGDVSQNIDNPRGLVPQYDIPDPSDVFTINSATGLLTTKIKLDRETKPEHIVFVRVRANGATAGDLTLVNVSVADTNDHRPEFSRDKYRLIVKEDTAVGSVITTLDVTDKDTGVNAELYFSLSDSSSSECLLDFNINERNGQLQVVKELDYETYIACQFTVLAYDRSPSPLTSSVEVDVLIDDVNDNSPTFSQLSYQIDVLESFRTETSIFGTVSDADSNENGRVELSDGNTCPFRIKTDTKSLVMTWGGTIQLDYETQTSYFCIIVATDMATTNRRTSSATVAVSITDVNDNPPIFTSLSYQVNISRDLSSGNNVFIVTATDADSGLNKQIRYDLTGDEDYLGIDPNSGQIYVAKSLYDYSRDTMVTTVTATDQIPGSPDRLSSSVTLTIYIEDANVRPNFPTLRVYRELREEREITGVFYTATANDWDGTTIRKCSCTYRLENPSDVFEVDSQSGEVRMKSGTSVDRERDGPYVSLGIIARDQGSPEKDSEPLILNITVLDINDQSPRFRYTSIPIFKIYQTHSPGSAIGTVTAEDNDGSQYSVTLYTVTDLFYSASGTFSDRNMSIFGPSTIVVDRENGTLRTTRSLQLSRQTATFYIILTLEAVDKNDPSMTDTTPVFVEVKYEDPNQHYPQFTEDVYRADISRSHSQTDVVLKVSASDADQPPKNTIKYSITGGNYRDVMSIDVLSGEITLAYPLDETFDASNITLIVRATDSGEIPKYSSSHAVIILTGDYQPCFTSEMRTEIVAEKDLFFGVMLGLVGALCIAIALCLILFYKYRTVDKQLAVYNPSKTKKKDQTYTDLRPDQERQDHDYTVSAGTLSGGGYEVLPGPADGAHPYSTVPEQGGIPQQHPPVSQLFPRAIVNPAFNANEDGGFPGNQRV